VQEPVGTTLKPTHNDAGQENVPETEPRQGIVQVLCRSASTSGQTWLGRLPLECVATAVNRRCKAVYEGHDCPGVSKVELDGPPLSSPFCRNHTDPAVRRVIEFLYPRQYNRYGLRINLASSAAIPVQTIAMALQRVLPFPV